MCSPVLKRGRASLVQVCTLSFISFLCPHPQPTAMSTTCLASNTVHQEAQTDGLTQTHFNGRILKGCLVGHIKKKIGLYFFDHINHRNLTPKQRFVLKISEIFFFHFFFYFTGSARDRILVIPWWVEKRR